MLWITLRAGLAADAHAWGEHLPSDGLKENHPCRETRGWIELAWHRLCWLAANHLPSGRKSGVVCSVCPPSAREALPLPIPCPVVIVR